MPRAAYVNDPLVDQGKIYTRLGVEVIKPMQVLPSQMSGIPMLVMILHGTKDRLSEPKGSQMLYDPFASA